MIADRTTVDRVSDAYAARFGIDPEHAMVDYKRGTVEVKAEHLAALLAALRMRDYALNGK